MPNEISILIMKVHAIETASKPAIHFRMKADTDIGPLVLKLSVSAARELRGCLEQLPPKLGFQSPAEKP